MNPTSSERAVRGSIPLPLIARAFSPTGWGGGVQRPFLKLPRFCGANWRARLGGGAALLVEAV